MGIHNHQDSSSDCDMALYDRLGGDEFVAQLTQNFWDEMLEHPALAHFFKHIAMETLKYHCVKFFRVVLGPAKDRPAIEEVMDFLLQTHSRLFREQNLQMEHFDHVADCLLSSLESFAVDQAKIKEVMEIWTATRDIFQYGCEVAANEKTMTPEELRMLPPATAKTMGTGARVRLPDYSQIDIPEWLPQALAKANRRRDVRAWTCDLTERFGAEGDRQIAKVFMYQPYMAHHVYCVAFLELAFMPDNTDTAHQLEILDIVLFPRGKDHSPLSRKIFERMIHQFQQTCERMCMPHHVTQGALDRLSRHRQAFGAHSNKGDGIHAPHVLCRSTKKKNKPLKPLTEKVSSCDDTDATSESGSTGEFTITSNASGGSLSISSTHSPSKHRGGGWLNFFSGQKKSSRAVQDEMSTAFWGGTAA